MNHPNILLIRMDEPNLATASADSGFLRIAAEPEDALRKYNALAAVLMHQLDGLRDCHVRIIVSPEDALDSVKFWLLPMLRGDVKKAPDQAANEPEYFHYVPEKNAPPFSIDFRSDEGDLSPYEKHARLNPYCVNCGSRWLNLAFSQCSPQQHISGDGYLEIQHRDASPDAPISQLPALEIIEDEAGWDAALRSPLGGKLKKFYTAGI